MPHPHVAILDDYDRLASASPAVADLCRFAAVRIFHERLAPADLPAALAGCSAVIPIRERTLFTAELLASLPDLRHLAQTGQGVAHIDVKAATQLGIAVSVTPGGSAQSVAELTLGLLLALVHRVGEGDRAMRRGEWPPLLGSEVGGKTLGLIGLGEIGREVAVRARAFGMRASLRTSAGRRRRHTSASSPVRYRTCGRFMAVRRPTSSIQMQSCARGAEPYA